MIDFRLRINVCSTIDILSDSDLSLHSIPFFLGDAHVSYSATRAAKGNSTFNTPLRLGIQMHASIIALASTK